MQHHRTVSWTQCPAPDAAPAGAVAEPCTAMSPGAVNVTAIEVLADRAFVAGSVVVEDYGDISNSVFLHHLGIQPPVNPFDCVPLPVANATAARVVRGGGAGDVDADELHGLAAPDTVGALLALLDVRPTNLACVMPGSLPSGLHTYMQVRYMTASTAAVCMQLLTGGGGRLGPSPTPAPSAARQQCLELATVSPAALQELHDAALQRLQSFPTSIDDDETMLRLNGKGSACRASPGGPAAEDVVTVLSAQLLLCLELSQGEECVHAGGRGWGLGVVVGREVWERSRRWGDGAGFCLRCIVCAWHATHRLLPVGHCAAFPVPFRHNVPLAWAVVLCALVCVCA